MANKKSTKIKEHKKTKKKSLTPEVLSPKTKLPVQPTMDGTRHTEISDMQTVGYSSEIIQEAREAFNLDRLKKEKEKGTAHFLAEGEKQILKLWQSIEALTTHNTLFVVLFLISIGEILNEIKSTLAPRDFVKWRREAFHYKHERYLQQAQQLARMGEFARCYASMGKKRLLDLDRLKRLDNIDNCEQFFDKHPLPDNVVINLETLVESLKENPIPDSTEDLEGDLLKEHTDAVITYHRLKSANINFATFDQAFLLAAYNKDAIPVKEAKKIKAWLDEMRTTQAKKNRFNTFVMDKGKIPGEKQFGSKSGASLNHILSTFVDYFSDKDFNDKEWIELQKTLIEESIFLETNKYLKLIGRKFKIKLSGNNQTK